jgi:hypothetical protein
MLVSWVDVEEVQIPPICAAGYLISYVESPLNGSNPTPSPSLIRDEPPLFPCLPSLESFLVSTGFESTISNPSRY